MSTISAGNTASTAIVITGDITGNLVLFATSNVVSMTTATGAFALPSGTTAQRPASATNGMIRYNSETAVLEGYINGAWVTVKGAAPYSVSYVMVAGGGAGGSWGGGGGAGGYLSGTSSLSVGTTYTFTVGAGGAAVTGNGAQGNNGSNSTAFSLTSIGGGGGGGGNAGLSGGSGGCSG